MTGAGGLHVVVLEPFFGGSHQVWAEGWQRHSRHRLHLLTQRGSHWRHRMMASAVPLAEATRAHIEAHGRPDVVVASDMVDLAAYLGLCRHGLSGVPTVAFFHENQLTQPVSPNGVGGLRDRHLAWTNWRSVAAADEVWFNSRWQRDSMEAGLAELLAGGPAEDDQQPLVETVRERFRIRPVGCELGELLANDRSSAPAAGAHGAPGSPVGAPGSTDGAMRGGVGTGTARGGPPLLVWNHRWAHDKGLDVAVGSLRSVAAHGLEFHLAVVGTDDHHDPGRGERLLEPLGDRVVHRGWLPPEEYRALLCRADVVLASARQENFGISVVEAVAAGCVPVVPDALAYPESIVDPALRYPPGRLTTRLREVLQDLPRWRELTEGVRAGLSRFDWSEVAPSDDRALEDLVARAAAGGTGAGNAPGGGPGGGGTPGAGR